MSFIRHIFSKKSEEDYETVLSNLANDIQKRQFQLSEIRLRERRSTLLVTLYTIAGWIAYVSLWHWGALTNFTFGKFIKNAAMIRALKGFPVVIGPIIILFVRRVVQIWYARKGDAEEKTLKVLMKQRRDKVEDLKKKTNYYSTRDLIQKYDEGSPSPTPLRQRLQTGQAVPATPQRRPTNQNSNGFPQTPAPNSGLQANFSPASPIAPLRKQWYDKLADAILGEDDPNFAAPSSRYALICEKCFNHNGLVKESMWADAQYVCPKCGHFNASSRSKKETLRDFASPVVSTESSPLHLPPLSPPDLHRQISGSSSTSATPNEEEKDLPTVDGTESSPMEVDSAEEITAQH